MRNCDKDSLVGQKYGLLTVIQPMPSDKFKQRMWLCRCECGNTLVTTTNRLHMGKARSCGCMKRLNNLKHGMSNSRLNAIYRKMKERCYSKENPRYKDYGGRGITICDEWLGKDGFSNFEDWAVNNGYEDSLSIDRIDNDKGYSPSNCRWATRKTQARNTRRNVFVTAFGKTQTIADWSDETGLPYTVIQARIQKLNWDAERAVTEEVHK